MDQFLYPLNVQKVLEITTPLKQIHYFILFIPFSRILNFFELVETPRSLSQPGARGGSQSLLRPGSVLLTPVTVIVYWR